MKNKNKDPVMVSWKNHYLFPSFSSVCSGGHRHCGPRNHFAWPFPLFNQHNWGFLYYCIVSQHQSCKILDLLFSHGSYIILFNTLSGNPSLFPLLASSTPYPGMSNKHCFQMSLLPGCKVILNPACCSIHHRCYSVDPLSLFILLPLKHV